MSPGMTLPAHAARPVWAEIDLAALRHNAGQVQSILRPGTALMAVVKANAYGHGMEQIARTLFREGVTRFGVASLEEALRLRAAGITGDILVLGYSDPAVSADLIAHGILQTVGRTDQIRALREAARQVGLPARVHVKVDTGMTRLGAPLTAAQEVLYEAMAHPEVTCRGIYTHFHSADLPAQLATIAQWHEFERLLQPMRKVMAQVTLHAANTAAVINYPQTHADMVRIGIALYGGLPAPSVPRTLDLRPVLTLKSRVVDVKQIPAGTGVGYGHRFVAAEAETIALLPIGYADGYLTAFSDRARVLVRGHRARVTGQVSMDFTAIRVPPGVPVSVGDEVVLLGSQGQEQIQLQELADWAGMVAYEPLSLLGPRIARHYLHDAESSASV